MKSLMRLTHVGICGSPRSNSWGDPALEKLDPTPGPTPGSWHRPTRNARHGRLVSSFKLRAVISIVISLCSFIKATTPGPFCQVLTGWRRAGVTWPPQG